MELKKYIEINKHFKFSFFLTRVINLPLAIVRTVKVSLFGPSPMLFTAETRMT